MTKEAHSVSAPQLTVQLGRYLLPLLLLGLAVHLILPQLAALDHSLQVIRGLIVHELSAFQIIGFGSTLLLLCLIAGIAVWGMHHRSRLTALVVRMASRWAALRHRPYDPAMAEATTEHWFSAWDTLRAGGWHGPALGAALNTLFDMLTLYFLFVASGHMVSPGVLLAGYGLPLLLGKVTFLPGGVGIVEGTMAALYDGLGVPAGVTAVVILTYRFLSFWLPLLVGFPLVPYLQRVCRDAKMHA